MSAVTLRCVALLYVKLRRFEFRFGSLPRPGSALDASRALATRARESYFWAPRTQRPPDLSESSSPRGFGAERKRASEERCDSAALAEEEEEEEPFVEVLFSFLERRMAISVRLSFGVGLATGWAKVKVKVIHSFAETTFALKAFALALNGVLPRIKAFLGAGAVSPFSRLGGSHK